MFQPRFVSALLMALALLASVRASAYTLFIIKPLEGGNLSIDSSATIPLNDYYGVYNSEAPQVAVATSQGDITLNLRPDLAPATVENFLNYVKSGAYTESIFHRSVPGFVIQTGGFRILYNEEGPYFDSVETLPPVVNEPNVSNTRGTIAMAKLGNDPNSATSQWFVNLADNGPNLDNQNGGFTVFGEVDEAGMAVVDLIAELPYYDIAEFMGIPAFTQVPLYNVQPDQTTVFLSNLVMVSSVTLVPLAPDSIPENDRPVFSIVANSNPERLDATLEDANLVLRPTGEGKGEVDIMIKTQHANDSIGITLTVTLTDPAILNLLPSAERIADQWWQSPWLGFIWAASAPWLYHPNLGWFYAASYQDPEAFWAWSPGESLGWLWTSDQVFPWLYRFEQEDYLYLDAEGSTPLRFFFPGQGWNTLP